MDRLTTTSPKGGLAFTFDLDITCKESEIRKIQKLGERLKYYEDSEENGLFAKKEDIANYSPKDFMSYILNTICDYAKANDFEATKMVKDIGENLVELSGMIDFDDLEGNL